MRNLLLALALFTSALGSSAAAQNGTVVELYTSQGCSSCPPADAMLVDLARRDDVIALALHVDYWDYLGWKDDLASPAFTRRQHAFAAAAGSPTVYTPQMIIGGVDHVIGSRPMQVMEQLMKHGAHANPVEITLVRNGDTLRIGATSRAGLRGAAVVQIVRFRSSVSRDIHRGENAGKTVHYVNVVYSWVNAGDWNTAAPLQMEATLAGADPVAVIIQDGTDGPVLGAAQLR